MRHNFNTLFLRVTVILFSLFLTQSAFAGCWFICGNIDRTSNKDNEKATNYFVNENGFKLMSSDEKESHLCRSDISVLIRKDDNEKMLSIKIGGKDPVDMTYLIENLKYDMDYGVFALSEKLSSDKRCNISEVEKDGTINELMLCSYKESDALPITTKQLDQAQSALKLPQCSE